MNLDELKPFHSPLFAERASLSEALSYAYSMHDPAVTTAVHVVLNTVITVLLQDSWKAKVRQLKAVI